MNHTCFFVPDHLLEAVARQLAARRSPDLESLRRSIAVSQQLRAQRAAGSGVQGDAAAQAPRQRRTAQRRTGEGEVEQLTFPGPSTSSRLIYDDQNSYAYDVVDVRNEGDPAVLQQNANDAYDGLGQTLHFYRDVLGRKSIDNAGQNVVGNVNYGTGFDNAFFDGYRMVFGNGDGSIFLDFTLDVDVPAHELTHGVTAATAGLQYTDQPGALNEATSDIMAACVDARVHGEDAGSFNWLIGEEIVGPNFFGEAIRSMKYPGSAYDGDPQPVDMSGYVPGGDPHVNSGIINRWFYLMATDLGMDAAALIWYQTLENLWATAQFADAAAVAALQARILSRSGQVPRNAPQTVRGTAREQGII
jgi:Zn-dependent metalloprotease